MTITADSTNVCTQFTFTNTCRSQNVKWWGSSGCWCITSSDVQRQTHLQKKIRLFIFMFLNLFMFCLRTEISDFVVCLLYYVRYHFLVYSYRHIFHQFNFFYAHIPNKLFSEFCVDKLLYFVFSSAPHPDIYWCVPCSMFHLGFTLISQRKLN